MALGKKHDFEMHRGDDREIPLHVVDQAGADVDITGVTGTDISWVLSRKDPTEDIPSGAALVTKTIGSGIVIVTPAEGRARVDVGPGDTSGLVPGVYYHEAQIVLGGKTTTILYGAITIRKDIVGV